MRFSVKCNKKAGAELFQAQDKVGLSTPALPSKKLWLPSISKDYEVLLYLQKYEVVLHLPRNLTKII